MAHSRPSTVRSNSSAPSPPPKSPGRHERPAHQRKKSGQFAVSERRASRPAPLNRRTTPQFITKVGAGWSGGKNLGKSDRDSRNFDEDDSRLSGEGFLQYCASCEKQINPHDSLSMLYCSEACRKQDIQPNPLASYNPNYSSYTPQSQFSPPLSPYSKVTTFDSLDNGPDIVPQFSPTQSTSRPRSYFNSLPIQLHLPSNSPPSPKSEYTSKATTTSSTSTMKRNSGSSTALESLRELAVALPATRDSRRNSRDKESKREYSPSASTSSVSSPPTPLSNSSNGVSGVWNYLPRTLSMASVYTRDIITASQAERYPGGGSPDRNSYGEPQYAVVKPQAQLLPPISLGMDRPLPPRSGGYGYGGRPKSVDLVTPISYNEPS